MILVALVFCFLDSSTTILAKCPSSLILSCNPSWNVRDESAIVDRPNRSVAEPLSRATFASSQKTLRRGFEASLVSAVVSAVVVDSASIPDVVPFWPTRCHEDHARSSNLCRRLRPRSLMHSWSSLGHGSTGGSDHSSLSFFSLRWSLENANPNSSALFKANPKCVLAS